VGLITSRGIVSYRALQAIYQAWRITPLAGTKPDVHVLEIGAGLGRTAYYAWRAGIRNYTIVDVPLTAVAQADFLGRTLGPDALTLAGEETGGPIRIYGPDWFQSSTERFDLALNVDSLTEMDLETALDYLRALAHCTRRFVSINHEQNEWRFADLLHIASVACTNLRFPYWMRDGYTEDIVTFAGPSAGSSDTAMTTLPNRQIAAQLRDYHRLRRIMNSRSAVFRRWLRLLFNKNLKGRSPDAGDDLL
jgi:hypothetical protein